MTFPYDREVLMNVVIYHHKTSIEGCICGWAELGKSIGEHVADVYESIVNPLPDINSQARIIYDNAQDWHEKGGHLGDVRKCADCKRSPYRAMLDMTFGKVSDGTPQPQEP